MQLLSLALALGTAYLQTAQAAPAPTVTSPPSYYTTSSCTSSTCTTYTNDCGSSYGGCYLDPSCGGTVPVWHPPPCLVTGLSARAATTATCSTSTCATYTNDCGATYGGCYLDPACGGTAPVWHPPLCPVTELDARAIPTPPTLTAREPCTTTTCATYTNSCGATYGGCFLDPACGGAEPTFHPPLCPVTDAAEPTITSPPTVTPTATSCTYSRCVDYINDCGQTYGGCFLDPACGGTVPVFHEPLCPATTMSPTAAGCPYAECATSTNACGATLTTCYLAVACGGTTPPVQTSTCTKDWTSESTTEVYTTPVSTTTTVY